MLFEHTALVVNTIANVNQDLNSFTTNSSIDTLNMVVDIKNSEVVLKQLVLLI